MAEYDRDRMDQAEDAVRDRNIVRDGGIGRSDADVEDAAGVTYGTPIESTVRDERDVADDDAARAGEVLGIARDVTPGGLDIGSGASGGSDPARRRRSDDLVDGGLGQDPSGSSYEGPDALKVRD